jgi:hypothetical protein
LGQLSAQLPDGPIAGFMEIAVIGGQDTVLRCCPQAARRTGHMAISYSFAVATRSTTAQVARALRDVAQASGLLGAPVTSESLITDGALTAAGTRLRVRDVRPEPWNPVVSDLGFTPTISVSFRLDSDSDITSQQDDMIRLVDGLLGLFTGDAVLHFEYEIIWLLRRDGDLSLNDEDDVWPPHRLALMSQPYRRATYHFAAE